jgi:hypothetical protein
MYYKVLLTIERHQWPWARARWVTALGLISKLGIIPKFLLRLILKGLNIFIYTKIKEAYIFKISL